MRCTDRDRHQHYIVPTNKGKSESDKSREKKLPSPLKGIYPAGFDVRFISSEYYNRRSITFRYDKSVGQIGNAVVRPGTSTEAAGCSWKNKPLLNQRAPDSPHVRKIIESFFRTAILYIAVIYILSCTEWLTTDGSTLYSMVKSDVLFLFMYF